MTLTIPKEFLPVEETEFWSLLDGVDWTKGDAYIGGEEFQVEGQVAGIRSDDNRHFVNPEVFKPIR